MTKMIRFLTFSMAFSLLFFTACTKDQRDMADTTVQQKIEQANQRLAPGTYELSPGVSVVSTQEGVSQSADGNVIDRGISPGPGTGPNTCLATINVVLGSGSTLLVDGVGTFTGYQNVTISFPISNGQSFTVAYGGLTGVTVTQLNTGGCVVFSVPSSPGYKVVSGTFKLYCTPNLCFEDLLTTPWVPFS